MKKTIVTAIIICGFIIQHADAQTLYDFKKMSADQKAKMLTDSLKVMLTLDNNQYNLVYTTLFDGASKATPIMESSESRRSKRQKLTSIGDQIEAKLKMELTASQYTLYQSKKEKLIAYYKGHFQANKLVVNVPD